MSWILVLLMVFLGASRSATPAVAAEVFPKQIYLLQALANGWASDQTGLSIWIYRNLDGIQISVSHGRFSSFEAARRELRHKVALADKILEQGPKRGRFGGVAGERAMLLFFADKTLQSVTAVVWTQGRDFYEIESVSRALVIDMERRYY